MKRRIRKLQLSKETVRTLSGSDLRGAAGGVTINCSGRCVPTGEFQCSFYTCACTDSGCASNQTACC